MPALGDVRRLPASRSVALRVDDWEGDAVTRKVRVRIT
jgi:hypothetical protein